MNLFEWSLDGILMNLTWKCSKLESKVSLKGGSGHSSYASENEKRSNYEDVESRFQKNEICRCSFARKLAKFWYFDIWKEKLSHLRKMVFTTKKTGKLEIFQKADKFLSICLHIHQLETSGMSHITNSIKKWNHTSRNYSSPFFAPVFRLN